MKIADLALMRLTPFPYNYKLTSFNFVKISVGCDSQDIASMTPFDSHLLCAATGVQNLSLSVYTTLSKLSRTLLNPLVSFDQSIH